jgi:hypothetical protein
MLRVGMKDQGYGGCGGFPRAVSTFQASSRASEQNFRHFFLPVRSIYEKQRTARYRNERAFRKRETFIAGGGILAQSEGTISRRFFKEL